MATALTLRLPQDARHRLSRRARDHNRTIEAELVGVLQDGAVPRQAASIREIAEQFRGIGFTAKERDAIAALRREPYARPVNFEDGVP